MDSELAANTASLEAGRRTSDAGPTLSRAKVVAYIEATKFRSVVLLGLVGLATGLWAWRELYRSGAFTAGSADAHAAGVRVALGTLAVILGSMGVNAITGAIDHRMDGAMSRTRHRPIPTGRLTPLQSMWFGVGLVGLGAVVTAFTGHLWSTFWLLFGALDVTLVYNGYSKPRTPWSVVLGSPASGAPVLVVYAAVAQTCTDYTALLLAGLVVVWTPIHVWSLAIRYVDDYRAAGVPMLPMAVGVKRAARCVAWASLGLCALAAALPSMLGLGFWTSVALFVLQVPIVLMSVAVMLKPDGPRSWALFKLSSPYLAFLFIIVAAAV